jgi:rod shape-determining protein MreD
VTRALDTLLLAAVVFVAALLQVTLVVSLGLGAGSADLLLLVVVAVGLLRGSVGGAVAGFFGGLLVDITTLDTMGVSALLFALAGYWTGRYGETTGRDRAHTPLLAVGVATIAVAVVGYALHFLVGDDISARRALIDALFPALVLNLLLGQPVFALVRSILRRSPATERVTEVRLLG